MELQIDLKVDGFVTMYKDGELDYRAEHQVRVWEYFYPTIYEFSKVQKAVAFIRVLEVLNEHYLLDNLHSSKLHTLLDKLHTEGIREELTLDKAMDIYEEYIVGRVKLYGIKDCYNHKEL